MATYIAPRNKCLIDGCLLFRCKDCWHWVDPDPSKPKHKCQERPKPKRELIKYCPNCSAGMGRYDALSFPEREVRERQVIKLGSRIVYAKEHPRKNGVRPTVQVRTTRTTNAARRFIAS
jgi:hypothetical protein